MVRSPHLTHAQLRDLEAELRRELARLDRAALTANAAPIREPIDAPGDALDGSAANAASFDPEGHGGLAVMLEARARSRRAEVVEALDRIASGEYGVCLRCRSAIPLGRLAIMPEAAFCVGCGAFS